MNDDLLNDFLLEAFPNPERKGCPDEKTLRAFAEDRLPPGNPSNPILQHVASCSECYAEYRHYRQDWKEASKAMPRAATPLQTSVGIPSTPQEPIVAALTARPKVLPWAMAAGVLLVLGGSLFLVKQHYTPAPQGALMASSSAPLTASVNLFNAVTVRGGSGDDPMPLEQVSLPSTVVHLDVILPRFSESGPYRIIVAKDKAGTEVVARGLGNAVEADGKVSVVVTLDLRKAAPGMYFLATVRGSDNGTYYYPLKVN